MLYWSRQVLRIVAADDGNFMRNLKLFAPATRGTRGTYLAFALVVAGFFGTTSAHADVSADDKQKARAAYIRATEANDRGDYATAARELALADELAPNAVTLQAALEAALDADAPAIGMELVTRAEIRGERGQIETLMANARKRFSERVGRVKIVCPDVPSCQATLDGEAIAVSTERFASVGKHAVVIVAGGVSKQRDINVVSRALALVAVSDVAAAPGPRAGLSPVWFAASLVATVAAGVGTGISGADTKQQHEAFVAARCTEAAPPATCNDLAGAGQSAQTRTNVLVGVTATLALSTIVLGAVTFSKKNAPSGPVSGFSLEPRPDGAFGRLMIVLP